MSKRKGGTHLENALAKFQCVPARVSPGPRPRFLRPREDPALTRCFPLPSPSLPPRSPQEGAAAEREDPDRRVEGPREARCEGERAAGAPQGDGRGGG